MVIQTIPVTRHRFTVAEYQKMGEAGIFHEDERVELIEGEIIEMTPIGPPHAGGVARLIRLFNEGLGSTIVLWVQNPVRLGEHSEPEPDLALLRDRPDFYATAIPGPADVLLIVEVADTTLAYDQNVKIPLYAQAGIPEVWIADLNGERILVYRDPGPDGYRRIFTVQGDERLSPQAFPDLVLTASQVLG